MSKKMVRGVAILSVAAIISKILGAIFKLPLTAAIGAEGIGYYQRSYEIFTIFLFTTAGFSSSISKLVSEKIGKGNYSTAHKVFKIAFLSILIISGFFTTILILNADNISNKVYNNSNMYYPILSLLPALFFVQIMSSFRGFFQGHENMKPTAISQVLEQLGRVIIGLILGIYIMNFYSKPYLAAAGAGFGTTVGGLIGLIYFIIIYFRYIKKNSTLLQTGNAESNKSILREMIYIAVPITLVASTPYIANVLDGIIINDKLLEIGYSNDEATALYGQLSGIARSLIMMPSSITLSVQVALLPAISMLIANNKQSQVNKTAQSGMKLSLIVALPCGIGLTLLATPIIQLVLGYSDMISADDIISTGRILGLTGIGCIFLALYQATSGVLQGLQKVYVPLINIVIASIVRLFLSYFLIDTYGIMGAAFALTVSYVISAILNLIAVRLNGIEIDPLITIIKPTLAALIMGIVTKLTFVYLPFSQNINVLASILISGIIYLVAIFKLKVITSEDLDIMPGGGRLMRRRRK